MGTTDRSLSLLRLFSLERPTWTAEETGERLGVSISTAYRYLLALEDVGLISATNPGRYVLGPAIIQLDRQIQLTDPLLIIAKPLMRDLATYAPVGSVILLCRSFSNKVLCIHQVFSRGSPPRISYERGRPMPLLRGATSKIALAFMPQRRLKALYLANSEEVQQACLGDSWELFRGNMMAMRKAGYARSIGEVDKGQMGLAVAILNDDRHTVNTLSFVVPDSTDENLALRLVSLLQSTAREIEVAMRGESYNT